MSDLNRAFGVYENQHLAEAALAELIGAGFSPGGIIVLHPENQASLDFALRHGTTVPAGIKDGIATGLPLDGHWGLLYPAEGPVQGALPGALAAMGIPAEWSDGTIREGNLLVSVECPFPESLILATTILQTTGASETSSSVLPECGCPLTGPARSAN